MEEKRLLVRPMAEDDIADVLAIEQASFKNPWTEAQFHYEIKDNPVATSMVLTYANKVIGYVDFWITFDSACINKIAIHESLRGHQLGKLLMQDTMLRLEHSDEVKAITLEVRVSNERAIQFYTDFGFDIVVTKKQYYEDGEDAYYMVKVVKNDEQNNLSN